MQSIYIYSGLISDSAHDGFPCRMDKILERYERYSYAEKALISAESESEVKHSRLYDI